ncbi:MAG: nitroreductase family protein, partial [Gammaproteobacteria bacterium]|nr:nitroreductase family protein [Gammaproteobacteria bacterium]
MTERLSYKLASLDDETLVKHAKELATNLSKRRSVRDFDPKPVAWEVIQASLEAACSAPSGANQQPWRFVAVGDGAVKRQIREAAEAEEREFYAHRASEEWLD